MARVRKATQTSEPTTVLGEAEAVLAALVDAADPERARFEKAYMKSALDFTGAPVTVLRAEARRLRDAWRHRSAADRRALAERLVRHGHFDVRKVGVKFLAHLAHATSKTPRALSVADLPWLVELVRFTAAWAHVDELATQVVAPILEAAPERPAVLRRWVKDESFWVRRAALLALEPSLRRGGGDFALFTELATPLLGEKEFFLRKAIGWTLRSAARTRPDAVRAYVAQHEGVMSGLTRREALKHL